MINFNLLGQPKDTKRKTFYIGFHDGQKFGEKPFMQYEPIPIKVDISHREAIRIVDELYARLKELTEQQPADNHGAWP